MKKLFVNLARVLFQGIDLLLFEYIVIVIFNSVNSNVSVITTLMFVITAAVPAVILFKILSRTPKFSDANSCKKAYPFISSCSLFDNGLFSAFSLTLLIASFILNYSQLNNYSELYPNAAEVLTEEFHVSEPAMVILESIPTWYSERLYYSAELVHTYVDIKSDTQLSEDDVEGKLDELSVQLNDKMDDLEEETVIGISVLLMFGVFWDMLMQSAAYHSSMRDFDTKEVE